MLDLQAISGMSEEEFYKHQADNPDGVISVHILSVDSILRLLESSPWYMELVLKRSDGLVILKRAYKREPHVFYKYADKMKVVKGSMDSLACGNPCAFLEHWSPELLGKSGWLGMLFYDTELYSTVFLNNTGGISVRTLREIYRMFPQLYSLSTVNSILDSGISARRFVHMANNGLLGDYTVRMSVDVVNWLKREIMVEQLTTPMPNMTRLNNELKELLVNAI